MKYNKKKLIDLIDSDRNSNKRIAELIGLSDNMIGKLARGESLPSVESLPLFAKLYKKDMNYFFDFDMPGKTIVSSPVEIYEPPAEIAGCYKIMFEQQKEITNQAKEIADLRVENERLKNANAPMNGAKNAG